MHCSVPGDFCPAAGTGTETAGPDPSRVDLMLEMGTSISDRMILVWIPKATQFKTDRTWDKQFLVQVLMYFLSRMNTVS